MKTERLYHSEYSDEEVDNLYAAIGEQLNEQEEIKNVRLENGALEFVTQSGRRFEVVLKEITTGW